MSRQSKFFGACLFLAGAVFYGYEYGLRIMPSIVMPEILHHFQISHAGFGYITASYYYAYVLCQIPAGLLIDRYGPIRLMGYACLACVIGATAFAVTDVFLIALGARFLIGAGSVFAFVGTLAIASRYLPLRYFAFLAGLTSAFGTFAGVFSDISLTHTIDHFGWIQANCIVVVFGLLLCGVFVMANKMMQGETTEDVHQGMAAILKGSAHFLKDPRFWLNATIGCLIYLPTTVFAEVWGIPYLRMGRAFTDHQAALAISFLFLGYGIGAPVAGWLSERIATKQTLLLVGGLFATVFSSLVLYLPTHTSWGVGTLLLLLGLSYGAQSLIFPIATSLVPENLSGSVLAFTNMMTMLGGVLLQPLVGHIIDWMYDAELAMGFALRGYQVALAVMPVGILISCLLSYIQIKKYSDDAGIV